jgi:hypothetical protein
MLKANNEDVHYLFKGLPKIIGIFLLNRRYEIAADQAEKVHHAGQG